MHIKKNITYISNLSLVKPNLNFSSNIDILHQDDSFTKEIVANNDVKHKILKGKG